jgi:LysM repeat protein
MLYETYTVKEGDTIDSIALIFNTDPESIVRANNLERVYYLMPGEKLRIPIKPPAGFEYYIVKHGDTLYSIGQKYNANPTTLSEINGLDVTGYLYPEEKILVPKTGVKTHITKEGDTLVDIIRNLNINENDLPTLLKGNKNIYLVPNQLIVFEGK